MKIKLISSIALIIMGGYLFHKGLSLQVVEIQILSMTCLLFGPIAIMREKKSVA